MRKMRNKTRVSVVVRRPMPNDALPAELVQAIGSEREQEKLQRLAKTVSTEMLISAPDRAAIATYLWLLATRPTVLKALTARRGAPRRMDKAWSIALDYLVTYERLRKSTAAFVDVAAAWNVKVKTAEGYYARWRHDVPHELKRLEKKHAAMDRDGLLGGISQHLRSLNK